MKFNPVYAKQFEKDLRRMIKRGKPLEKIKTVMTRLIKGEPLEKRLRDHKLVGNYQHRRECHVEPDWLLIYKTTEADIIFERTGTHADLFE